MNLNMAARRIAGFYESEIILRHCRARQQKQRAQ
jgi:hypothetical protein